MRIELRFFASVREQLGASREAVTVPRAVQTIGDLRDWLAARGPVWRAALAENPALRIALDHDVVTADAPLRDGSEVAFFPPVTGG